ncbi:hypothetical protein DU508_22930 [Pedobacter chinensis]|uniref:Uncharacterized protein n=1 Tax=Pedobacter chinensis TaxID=2282421 RepID=A0A369PVP1_9SPHI|nr:hypothetical protein DU508_22930 [Pedobacter chinensis]
MNFYKLISKTTIFFCVIGLILAIGQNSYVNRIFAICINSLAMFFLIRTLNYPNKNRVVLLIVYAIQIFSLKLGILSYLVTIGLGYIPYFSFENLKHTSDLFTFSTNRIYMPTNLTGIGVNMLSLGIFLFLVFYRYKKESL